MFWREQGIILWDFKRLRRSLLYVIHQRSNVNRKQWNKPLMLGWFSFRTELLIESTGLIGWVSLFLICIHWSSRLYKLTFFKQKEAWIARMCSGPGAGMASINRSPRWSMCERRRQRCWTGRHRCCCKHKPGSSYFRSSLTDIVDSNTWAHVQDSEISRDWRLLLQGEIKDSMRSVAQRSVSLTSTYRLDVTTQEDTHGSKHWKRFQVLETCVYVLFIDCIIHGCSVCEGAHLFLILSFDCWWGLVGNSELSFIQV